MQHGEKKKVTIENKTNTSNLSEESPAARGFEMYAAYANSPAENIERLSGLHGVVVRGLLFLFIHATTTLTC